VTAEQFTTADLEYYSDLRRFWQRVDADNSGANSTVPVSFDIYGLDIEISVLTPLKKTSIDEIVVGRDGLMISMGNRRGLLLPQVAAEYGWTRDEFLQHTCQKAGLPVDAYKSPDATIQRFQAIVFGEIESGNK